MRPLRLFLKGNHDATDALLPLLGFRPESGSGVGTPSLGGKSEVQLTHEMGVRPDVLMQGGCVPEEVVAQEFEGNRKWISDQFESSVFDAAADAVILTLQPGVTDRAWRHRTRGFLLTPPEDWAQLWTAAQKTWLAEEFSPVGLIPAGDFGTLFRALVRRIREQTGAPVLVLNCSSVDPEDEAFRYTGVDDSWPVRAQRFNLALLEISALEGISIIDVDRVIGELGGATHVRQFLRYSPEASAAIRRECLRVIEDSGALDRLRTRPADGSGPDQPGALRFTMPFVHRLASRGTIVRWRKRVGEYVRYGDDLVDIDMRIPGRRGRSRQERVRYLAESPSPTSESLATEGDERGITMSVRVTSSASGYLRRVDAAEGSEHSVGDLLAVLAADDKGPLGDLPQTGDQGGTFRVVVNIDARE